jgi:hypothetical protein
LVLTSIPLVGIDDDDLWPGIDALASELSADAARECSSLRRVKESLWIIGRRRISTFGLGFWLMKALHFFQ